MFQALCQSLISKKCLKNNRLNKYWISGGLNLPANLADWLGKNNRASAGSNGRLTDPLKLGPPLAQVNPNIDVPVRAV
jgi:hypothetical protein